MIKYHAQFLLDKEKDNPTAKLRYRIKWDKNIVAFNVGFRIEISKWSIETQRCKANTTHGERKISASIINKKIQFYETTCESLFIKYQSFEKTPSLLEFKDEFNKLIGKVSQKDIKEEKGFFEYFNDFILEESKLNNWSESTIKKVNTTLTHLKNYNKNLTLNELNESKLIEIQYYFQKKLCQKNSTTSKNISILKWFLRWVKRKGYNINLDFEKFTPKLKIIPKKIIFLTVGELKKLKDIKIPIKKKYLERVRDIFLFQCYTGLRYSDVENLKKSDVFDDYIEITTIKTRDNLKIELNNSSREIINKYKKLLIDEKLFPVITNQKMNEYLKELCELAEINEPIRDTFYDGNKRIDTVTPKYDLIGTHAGRRTFICNALTLGIPPHIVMKWTGHTDYKSMKPYIDIADESKVNAMEKFNLL